MKLTPEEKQRIEEEEGKQVAEERYRAEVRARATGNAPVKRSLNGWTFGFLLIALIAVVLFWSNASVRTRAAQVKAAETRWVPVDQKIATGQIIVKAQRYIQYRIVITPEMVTPSVTGNFTASGGGGNDIEAVIADETNIPNWINGHQAQVFWHTPGRETTGNFDLRLRPGVYYLVFNNRFSLFTDKEIFLEVDLNYKKAETGATT